MENSGLSVVTGASGYTGKYITRLLLAGGSRVLNMTGHPERPHEFGDPVKSVPFQFDRPEELTGSLLGVDTFYNTYWVRFPRRNVTFDSAVRNTRTLITAAKEAGVRRFVHVSIANPSLDSPLAYYRGKALLEKALQESGLSYAILRPTVIFGREDILINNIAWFVRRFPVFAVPGSGRYRIQPIFVEDMARLAVEAGAGRDNVVLDAVGPETFTFDEFVRLMAREFGRPGRLAHLPPRLVHVLIAAMGPLVRDVILTWEEIDGLMADLLASSQKPTGSTLFSRWLDENAQNLGLRYTSEIIRHFK